MRYDSFKHHRRSIRLKGYDYSSEGAYFVTICAKNRECVFGDVLDGRIRLNALGRIARQEWIQTACVRPYVLIDEYAVMPNHLHGILWIVGATRRVAQNHDVPLRVSHRDTPTGPVIDSIGAILCQFKSIVTKQIRERGFDQFQWQRNYYERIIRNDDELNRIRQYIIDNPENWEKDPENLQGRTGRA